MVPTYLYVMFFVDGFLIVYITAPKKLPAHKHATYLQFNLTGDIPHKPSVYAIETLKVKFVSNDEYNMVKAVIMYFNYVLIVY